MSQNIYRLRLGTTVTVNEFEWIWKTENNDDKRWWGGAFSDGRKVDRWWETGGKGLERSVPMSYNIVKG